LSGAYELIERSIPAWVFCEASAVSGGLLIQQQRTSTGFNNFQHLCSQNKSNDLLKAVEIHLKKV
jgi:hypothetical protein